MLKSSSRRPCTLGVLSAQLDDAYQSAVWRGIECRARERGVGLVCFLGSRIGSPVASEAAANIAFRIAGRRNADGLIVVSSTIATFLDAEGVRQLFASRAPLPQVSVGLRVPAVPSVLADGTDGVVTVVRHLVRDHGRRRFALIDGPPGHPEAAERVRAFHIALEEAGISPQEVPTAAGSFVQTSGAEAARSLLDGGRCFDALVCMNDRMALGAMLVLREAGIRVPDDVAVVGFDGIEEGRFATPPLTTVMQPLLQLGCAAVDSALDLMDGAEPRDRVLPCVPVIRQSCGCPPRLVAEPAASPRVAALTDEERATVRKLTARARRADGDGFIACLNEALRETTLAGGEPTRWNDILSVVRRAVRPRGTAEAEVLAGLFESARVLVGETDSRLQAARRVDTEERLTTLRSIGASLGGAFEMPVMLARLEDGLERLGIDSGYLVLFDGPSPEEGWSRLVMAPRERRPKPGRRSGRRFRTVRLLPPDIPGRWRRGHWVLEPLVFQDEPLGYMMLSGGIEDCGVYASLPQQVASALKGALLLRQVRSHERRLEGEVARRTAELTEANRELTREIERRRVLEREVLEISNSTMQRIGQDLHDDLCQHLAGIAMLARVLRAGLGASDSVAVASIEKIGSLLEDSIVRAKQIARGLYPAGLVEHGLPAAVEELVEAARRSYSTEIDFRADPDFSLTDTDRALQVYRIIQEALANALKHSGSPRVEVRLRRGGAVARPGGGPIARPRAGGNGRSALASELVAEVTDYGSGLPASSATEGMGLRIMRYRAETADARLVIEPLAPGTRVSCRIPVRPVQWPDQGGREH